MSFGCPKCPGAKLRCLETRSADNLIYRRYRCPSCGLVARTSEKPMSIEVQPVTRNRKPVAPPAPPKPPKVIPPKVEKKPVRERKVREAYGLLDKEEDYGVDRDVADLVSGWGRSDDWN